MRVIHTGQDFKREAADRVLFLAGPTPRSTNVISWRPKVLGLLSDFLFDGVVIVPEHPKEGALTKTAEEIYAWEWASLECAGVIAFWVPRDMTTLPGLTTNIEFGLWLRSGKMVFGAPREACDVNYMRWACEQERIASAFTLEATMHLAVLKSSMPAGRAA